MGFFRKVWRNLTMCCPCKKIKKKYLIEEKNLKTFESEIEVTEKDEHEHEMTEKEIPVENITEIIEEIMLLKFVKK